MWILFGRSMSCAACQLCNLFERSGALLGKIMKESIPDMTRSQLISVEGFFHNRLVSDSGSCSMFRFWLLLRLCFCLRPAELETPQFDRNKVKGDNECRYFSIGIRQDVMYND